MNRQRSSEHRTAEHHTTEPPSQTNSSSQGAHAGSLHSWMMTACLAVMGGAMLLIWRTQSLAGGAWLLLPMALCLGAHLLLHRHHGHHHRKQRSDD